MLAINFLKPEDRFIKKKMISVTERSYEYAFVVENLKNIKNAKKILDVGCANSVLSAILVAQGYNITGIDIRKWELIYKNFVMVVDDIKTTKLSSESFDVVIAVSTIEHVGLVGRYGEDSDPIGDIKAVEQIYRILKKGGYFIITVPYGRDFISPLIYRIYGRESFNNLTKKFLIEKQVYYKSIYNKYRNFYVECSEEDTIKIDPSKSIYAITCALMKKE